MLERDFVRLCKGPLFGIPDKGRYRDKGSGQGNRYPSYAISLIRIYKLITKWTPSSHAGLYHIIIKAVRTYLTGVSSLTRGGAAKYLLENPPNGPPTVPTSAHGER